LSCADNPDCFAFECKQLVCLFAAAPCCRTLRINCVDGIEANEDRLAAMVASSVGVITALIPVIGYEEAAKLAKKALATGAPIRELVVEAGLMSFDEVDAALSPEKLSNSGG
jgi:aspartate ammonia-lyase